MLRRMFWSSAFYAGLGLAAGLFYRELTRVNPGADPTQLPVAHTHFLVLGMFIGLFALILEKMFRLSESRFSKAFEITWHIGVLVTAGAMIAKGTMTTLGVAFNDKMFAGISGSGHIVLAAAFILLFVMLGQAVLRSDAVSVDDAAGERPVELVGSN